jgi:hypothetical protein
MLQDGILIMIQVVVMVISMHLKDLIRLYGLVLAVMKLQYVMIMMHVTRAKMVDVNIQILGMIVMESV